MFHQFPKGNIHRTGRGRKLPRLRGLPQIPLLPFPDSLRGQRMPAIPERYFLVRPVLPEVSPLAALPAALSAWLSAALPVGLVMALPVELLMVLTVWLPVAKLAALPMALPASPPAAEPALRIPGRLRYCPRRWLRMPMLPAVPDGCPL